MTNTTFGFEELEVWKKSRAYKTQVLTLVKGFPTEERYRLSDQLIRSARSITALLAEGHGRFTYADQIHFCIQSRGSLSETVNHLIEAFDNDYINEAILTTFKLMAKEIEKLLNGYITYLRNCKEKSLK